MESKAGAKEREIGEKLREMLREEGEGENWEIVRDEDGQRLVCFDEPFTLVPARVLKDVMASQMWEKHRPKGRAWKEFNKWWFEYVEKNPPGREFLLSDFSEYVRFMLKMVAEFEREQRR